MKEKIPNFFIVGAPKSGTTSLYKYLSTHPNIFMSTPKEPNFFSSDLNGLNCVNTLDEYQSLFKKTNKSQIIIGEASVWYLYSEKALTNIYDYNNNAKIIVMLRNPIDLYSSLHQHFIYNGFEDRENLTEAWQCQLSRKNGNNIPMSCPEPKLLQYGDVLKMGHQTDRLLSIFPKSQVKFILFEDFVSKTLTEYKSVLSFLELEYDGRDDFPIINKSKQSRNKVLNDYLLNPPRCLRKIWKLLKKIIGDNMINLANKLILMNSKILIKKNNIDDILINNLKNQLTNDIKKLSINIDRDLKIWLQS